LVWPKSFLKSKDYNFPPEATDKMKNVTLTNADLTAYSGEHLLYELQYFWFTASELSKMTKPAPLTSVFIESFGIHLVNLIDFFFTTPGDERPNDVIAADFCPSRNETISATLKAARVRANKSPRCSLPSLEN
jgi:hypothetical protein